MEITSKPKHKFQRHVAALPVPTRGHVNPIPNFCRLLPASGVHVSFIVTEEWLGLIGSPLKIDESISFVTVPSVIPSDKTKVANISGVFKALQEDLQEPVERLLDKLEPPPDFIIAEEEGAMKKRRDDLPGSSRRRKQLRFHLLGIGKVVVSCVRS